MNELSVFFSELFDTGKISLELSKLWEVLFQGLTGKAEQQHVCHVLSRGFIVSEIGFETMDGLAMLWGSVCVELLETWRSIKDGERQWSMVMVSLCFTVVIFDEFQDVLVFFVVCKYVCVCVRIVKWATSGQVDILILRNVQEEQITTSCSVIHHSS